MDLSHHLHLVGVVHDELLGVASVACVPLASRNNFALACDSWDLVVVLLNG